MLEERMDDIESSRKLDVENNIKSFKKISDINEKFEFNVAQQTKRLKDFEEMFLRLKEETDNYGDIVNKQKNQLVE